MDIASATEAVNSGSIPGRVQPKPIKIGIHTYPAWRSALKGTVWSLRVCGKQVGRWQLDSKTERSLCCLLAKATWWIKCNYNYNYKYDQLWCHSYCLKMLRAKDYRGLPHIGEKFERKQLRHFSWIHSGLKNPNFLHIATAFCMQR